MPGGHDLWAAIQRLLETYTHDWREDWDYPPAGGRGTIGKRQRRFEEEYDELVTGIRGRLAQSAQCSLPAA